MSLTTLALDHLPPGHAVHIALFHSVTNAAVLHSHLLAGNTDFEYAFIDASLVSPGPPFPALQSCLVTLESRDLPLTDAADSLEGAGPRRGLQGYKR